MVVLAVVGLGNNAVLALLAKSDPLEALVAAVADEGARHPVEFVYGVELNLLALLAGRLGPGRAAVLGRLEVWPNEGIFLRQPGAEKAAAREREKTGRQDFPRE